MFYLPNKANTGSNAWNTKPKLSFMLFAFLS